MKHLYFATTNKGKALTAKQALALYDISVTHVHLELPEPRSDDLVVITQAKILKAYEFIKNPCIALDAGFYVHSLNGYPGTYVNHMLDKLGLEGLLCLTAGKPRECTFRSCLAYYDGSEPLFFHSDTTGTLSLHPRGQKQEYHWSPLFQVFIPTGQTKTLAEMTPEHYAQWQLSRSAHSSFTKLAKALTF